jgi:hypothetical protein
MSPCARTDGRSITIMDFDKLSLLSDFEKSYLGQVLGQVCRLEPYVTRSAEAQGLKRKTRF